MFIKLFFTVLSIFLMMFLGVIARKVGLFDTNTIRQMSYVNIRFFYPALIFSSLVSNFTGKTLLANSNLPLGTIIIMSSGYLYGLLFSKIMSFADQKEKDSFRFQCTINNYTFLPLPIVFMLWGNKGVALLIISSLGAEICLWTIGILSLTGNRFSKTSLKNILSVPLITIVFSFFVITIRDYLLSNNTLSAFVTNPVFSQFGNSFISALDICGKAAVPVAMLIVGGRISDLVWKHIFTLKQIYLSIIRLVVIPATSLAIFYCLPFEKNINLVLAVVAIMPSAVVTVALSEVYDSDVKFSATGVLTTHLFSLITLPVWLYVIINYIH